MKYNLRFKRYIKNNPLQEKGIRFYFNGSKRWFLNGFLHREDGPAVEDDSGRKCWYIKGREYFEEDYLIALEEYKRNKK